MKNRIFTTILLVVFVMGMSVSPVRAQDGGYTITDLGTLGGRYRVRLVAPRQNAKLQQNNPSIGCPLDPTRGYGFQIYFDWAPSVDQDGIAYYDLLVQRAGSQIPMIRTSTTASDYVFRECGSFVMDANLTGWTWSVRAVDNLGNVGRWKTRKFSFEPCRLANGVACFAN